MASPPSTAAEKLQEWMDRTDEPAVAQKPETWLQEVLKRLDADLQNSATKTHRQSVYATLVGAVHTYCRNQNIPAQTTLNLFNALVAVAGHEQKVSELQPEQQRFSKPANDEFDKAVLVVAMEVTPGERKNILRWAKSALGLSERQASKVIDNWKQGRLKGLDRHVSYLRDCAKADDLYWHPTSSNLK